MLREPTRHRRSQRTPGIPHIFLPYRAIEGVLRALERLKIVPTSLDYSTIRERVRNMNMKFPETNDRLEAYMLYALINGNEKLAKAHALYGAASVAGKLPARLFLEAYKECCDLKSEEFRRVIARLFFYHV